MLEDFISLGKGEVKFLIIAVHYFTKWVEVEPLATITTKVVTKFLWKSIVCRQEILQSIVSDNKWQFDSEHYQEWCAKLRIWVKYSSLGTHRRMDRLRPQTKHYWQS